MRPRAVTVSQTERPTRSAAAAVASPLAAANAATPTGRKRTASTSYADARDVNAAAAVDLLQQRLTTSAVSSASAQQPTASATPAVPSLWTRFVKVFQGALGIDEAADGEAVDENGRPASRSKRAKRQRSAAQMAAPASPALQELMTIQVHKGPLLTPGRNGAMVEKIGLAPLVDQVPVEHSEQPSAVPAAAAALSQVDRFRQTAGIGPTKSPSTRQRVRQFLRSYYNVAPLTPNSRRRR